MNNITGSDLIKLRKAAEKNQKQIAEAMKLDQSTVSRMESTGQLEKNDLKNYLMAVASTDAQKFWKHFESNWQAIPKPSFWHPNREDLELINGALVKIDEFLSKANARVAISEQLRQYAENLRRIADYLADIKHNIAFVGALMVGKTTALSFLANLLISAIAGRELNGLKQKVVLDTGSGWVTLCEVQISSTGSESTAPYRFGLIIQPQPNEEVIRLVGDLCASTFETLEGGDTESRVTREMSRALKSMAGLTRKSMSLPDPLAELAKKCSGPEQLTSEFLGLMKLENRSSCSFWHDAADFESGLIWLQKEFSDVNNGRNPQAPLPRQIDVMIPAALFAECPYIITLVDTKGVDGTAVRTDIEAHLDDPRTLTVLCSRFAPDPAMLGVLEHLAKTGKTNTIGQRLVFLTLPREQEASAITNEDGSPVASKEEAYAIRIEQIGSELLNYPGAKNLPVLCYDADQDTKEPTVDRLKRKVQVMRQTYADRASDLTAAINDVIDNYAKKEVSQKRGEAFEKICNLLETFLTLPPRTQSVQKNFMRALRTSHPRRIWASVRRNGDWDNLNSYLHLSLGANIDAKQRSDAALDGLIKLVDQLILSPHFEVIRSELTVMKADVAKWREEFLDEVKSKTKDMFLGVLFLDNKVWNECLAFWGRGFRDNAGTRLDQWFAEVDHKWIDDAVEGFIVTKWQEFFIARLQSATRTQSLNMNKINQGAPKQPL